MKNNGCGEKGIITIPPFYEKRILTCGEDGFIKRSDVVELLKK